MPFSLHRHTEQTSLGLLPEQRSEAGAPRGAPCFFTLKEAEELELVLARGQRLFFQAADSHNNEKDLLLAAGEEPDFGLGVSSRIAYDRHFGALVMAAISQRFGLSRTRSEQVHTCLQEAVVNAIVHGNLDVQKDCSQSSDLYAYYACVEAALAKQPALRVYVLVWEYGRSLKFCVRHAGKGRLRDGLITATHPALDQKSGRGLYIIQSLAEQVWCDEPGKSLYFTFAC